MAVVRYFAAAQEAVGLESEHRTEATLADLRAAVATEYPGLGGILPRCAVLVDGARLGDDALLADAATVDILPPFAGG